MSVRNAIAAEERAKKFMVERFKFKDEESSTMKVGFDGTFFTVHLLAEPTKNYECEYLIRYNGECRSLGNRA